MIGEFALKKVCASDVLKSYYWGISVSVNEDFLFVSRFSVGNDDFVELEVREMEEDDIVWWKDNVQPSINARSEDRADKGWNWDWISRVVLKVGGFLSQDPRCLVVSLKDEPTFVCAMIGLVRVYPQPLHAASSFLWYLSSAPGEVFSSFGYSRPSGLGEVGIDICIVEALRKYGYDGGVWLHAAPEGGDRLMNWYNTTLGMSRLPEDLPLSYSRRNDGRYFYGYDNWLQERYSAFSDCR
jgi:hypothetical protein